MPSIQNYDVVIVGAGPAGLTAALYCGRALLKTAILEKGLPGGELLNTEYLDDVPGFPKILGWELAQKYADHAKQFGADFVELTPVKSVAKQPDGYFLTETDEGHVYRSPAVIVTAGGTPVKLGVPGEAEYAGKGVSYCAVCDGAFFRDQRVAVVGGGESALEAADFLTRFATHVYVLVRGNSFRASPGIVARVRDNPKVTVLMNTEVQEINGQDGLVSEVFLKNAQVLDVQGVFVFVGFKPNTGVISDHYEHDAGGHVITDYRMMSSTPGLFVAGDMRSQLTRQVTTACGDATTAAVAVDEYIKSLK